MGSIRNTIEKLAKNNAVNAVDMMINTIEDTVDDAMSDYYNDYKPKQYERTDLMRNSVMSIPATSDSDGASGRVYILDSKYDKPWYVSDSIEAADRHTHGGYKATSGVSVWKEPMERIESDEEVLWRMALINAGFNII